MTRDSIGYKVGNFFLNRRLQTVQKGVTWKFIQWCVLCISFSKSFDVVMRQDILKEQKGGRELGHTEKGSAYGLDSI